MTSAWPRSTTSSAATSTRSSTIRYGLRSTIIASQVLTTQWHAHIGDLTLADAICDRLFHNAHKLVLQGPSRRKPEGTD